MQTINENGVEYIIPDGATLTRGVIEDTNTKITKLAFKQRLTQSERIAIRTAAATNPIVYDFLDIMDSATFIDLSRQDTIDGVNAMEAAGLLAVGRADEILNNPVQPDEEYRS